MQQTQLKTCSKCKEAKDVIEFGKDRSERSGLNTYCKLCSRINSRKAYEKENKEAFDRAGGKCVLCKSAESLHVHHIYGKRYSSATIVVCKHCHLSKCHNGSYGKKVPQHQCNRCDHYWFPSTHNPPKVCPKCKSKYWNKERVYNLPTK